MASDLKPSARILDRIVRGESAVEKAHTGLRPADRILERARVSLGDRDTDRHFLAPIERAQVALGQTEPERPFVPPLARARVALGQSKQQLHPTLERLRETQGPAAYAKAVAARREAAIAAEAPTGQQVGWGGFGKGMGRTAALLTGGGEGLRTFDRFLKGTIAPTEAVGMGAFRYPPGRLPGRDLPVPEPSSASRIVEQKPAALGETLYHGTAARPFDRYQVGQGALGEGVYVTNSPQYASYFSRLRSQVADPELNEAALQQAADDGGRPRVNLHRVTPGELYDLNAGGETMQRQIDRVARAFADRQALKTKHPGLWGQFYKNARERLDKEEYGLVGQNKGGMGGLGDLARSSVGMDMKMRSPYYQGVGLRQKNLLRHAGFSGVRSPNDFLGGWQAALFAPGAQLHRPFGPIRRPPPAPPVNQKRISNAFDEGRSWLQDLGWGNMEPDDFESLSDDQIQRAVDRYYEGGWDAFAGEFARTEAPQVPTVDPNQLMRQRLQMRRPPG